MEKWSAYELVSTVRAGTETTFHRAYRRSDRLQIVLKAPSDVRPSPHVEARLRREHDILAALRLPGVVTCHGLVQHATGVAIALEEVAAEPLDRILARGRLSTRGALEIGAAIAEVLAALQREGVVHRQIAPHHVLVDMVSRHVTLVDFALAARMSRDTPMPVSSTDQVALAYMAPEQTGRTSRTVDQRADLYSLGVSLYEMLTGTLPFRGDDPIAIMHAHVARQAKAPREIVGELPAVVSDLVMRLLAKAPEDRYQSAVGLLADLKECLARLDDAEVIAPFALGRHEPKGALRRPDALYGREAERAALLASWQRAAAGRAQIVLVQGSAGTGKSALVREIEAPVVAQGGHFAAGKFDLLRQSVPYAPLLDVLRSLARSILDGTPERAEHYRSAIEEALGPNSRLLAHLVPELERLVGPKPDLPELGPSESQNRFHMALERFVGVLATRDRPLAMFLDDLQWADAASLRLVFTLVSNLADAPLLVIGAYRGDELDAGHPLALELQGRAQTEAAPTMIEVGPISTEDTCLLVANALGAEAEEMRPFAALLHGRTGGNPFFLYQILFDAHRAGIVSFDSRTERFALDLARIEALAEDVVDYLISKIRKLSPSAQRALVFAACAGHEFDPELIAAACAAQEAEVEAWLREALEAGFVLPADSRRHEGSADRAGADVPRRATLRFVHDRVQQAAAALLQEGERGAIHIPFGRLFVARWRSTGADEMLFRAAHHLGQGAALIDDPDERIAVARLLLTAAKKAKLAAAYSAAAGYLRAATTLLGADAWERDFDLAFTIGAERAACEYLCGTFEEAERLFEELTARARNTVERAQIGSTRVILYGGRGLLDRALQVGIACLRTLGIDLLDTEEQRQPEVALALARIEASLATRTIASLIDAPVLSDPETAVALRLLHDLSAPAHLTTPNLFHLVVLGQVQIRLAHGNADASPYAYMLYAYELATAFSKPREAYAFGALALELAKRFPDPGLTCQLHFLFAILIHLCEPLRSALPHFEQAIQAGLAAGDLIYLSYACTHALIARLALGDPLSEVRSDAERYLSLMQRTRVASSIAAQTITRQLALSLAGDTTNDLTLSDGTFEEAPFVEKIKDLFFATAWYRTAKLALLCIHGAYDEAVDMAALAEEKYGGSASFYFMTELPLYGSIALLARLPHLAPERRAQEQARLERFRERLSTWAALCPANYRHADLLVRAEAARADGDDLSAISLYEEAIDAARRAERRNGEALACELAARFHIAHGRPRLARAYLEDASDAYLRWGATRKAARLAEQWPDLLRPANRTHAGGSDMGWSGVALDTAAIVRAGQAIASEHVLERVVERLLTIILESTGAQRGALLLPRDGELVVEATIAIEPHAMQMGLGAPLEGRDDLPRSVLRHVAQTGDVVVLGDGSRDARFASDPYLRARTPRSLLCLSMTQGAKLVGLLYLENNASPDVFTLSRVELCRMLCAQAAISVEKAFLIASVEAARADLARGNEMLEREVARRTEELRRAHDKLAAQLADREQAEHERERLRQEVIRVQRDMLAELSTPLIPIDERIMVMPLIGIVDTDRARRATEAALRGVSERGADVVIIDVTGVRTVDATVAAALVQTAAALRLLGASVVLTGVSPHVAQTLIGLDVNLGAIVTRGSLQSGIAYARKIRRA